MSRQDGVLPCEGLNFPSLKISLKPEYKGLGAAPTIAFDGYLRRIIKSIYFI